MNRLTKIMRWAMVLGLGVACFGAMAAETPDDSAVRQTLVQATLAEGTNQTRLLAELGDSGSKYAAEVLTAWLHDSLYLYAAPDGAKVPMLLEDATESTAKLRGIRVDNGKPVTDAKGVEMRFGASELNSVDTDSRLRSVIQQAIDKLALSDPDPEARQAAALKLGNSQKQRYIPILQERLTKEKNAEVTRALREGVAMLQLFSSDVPTQVAAARDLGEMKSIGSLETLKRITNKPDCPLDLSREAGKSVSVIEAHISFVNFVGTIFHGISLGSVLLVVALGLAITFGLMGIINMAHGEMIAVGAYTCYVVQNLFGAGFGFSIVLPISFGGKLISFGMHLPGMHATGWVYESYFLLAIPLSFVMGALAGLAIERTVIRFLYRRPLESLLATWGVSLVMQQCFRMVFGANNVQVNSPSWLLGHFSINEIGFDYNRVFVVVFAVLIVLGTWLLLTKTPLGLLIRAAMQNRAMASCLGVRTERVNMMTFAFGSGLAGLAGAFLSQIGNVGPSLGQTYIVDSFMTVVLGGVGNIVGTVWSAFGIGTVDQVLQQTTGSPVTGKIVVLVSIIVFLQWKPGGLFASRSRSLD